MQQTFFTPRKMRSFISIWAFLLVISSVSVSLHAQENSEQTMRLDSINIDERIDIRQAIQIALSNNTQMKQALLSVRDADQQVLSAWGNVMPDVSVSANYTRNLEVPVNFIPETVFDPQNGDPNTLVPIAFGTDNNWIGGITVSQIIFSGQAFVGISSAELFKAAQSENLRAVAQGIVTQTRVSYHQVLLAKEQIRLLEKQLERVEEQLSDMQKRAEQGLVDDYVVLQLEVQRDNIVPQLTKAKFAEMNARRNLLNVLGLPVQLKIDVKGELQSYSITGDGELSPENEAISTISTLTPLNLENDLADSPAIFDRRADLRILDTQRELQKRKLTADKSAYLPTLAANYNMQWTAAQPGSPDFFGTEDQRARSQTLSLSFQLPLFQGMQRHTTVQRTKIAIKDLRLQQEQTQRDAQNQIISAQESIREALQTNDGLLKALDQAKLGYERALIRYKNGVGSQQEVTDADLQLREAESNYAQMVAGYLLAKAQYDQAIGQVPFIELSIEDIKEKIDLK